MLKFANFVHVSGYNISVMWKLFSRVCPYLPITGVDYSRNWNFMEWLGPSLL